MSNAMPWARKPQMGDRAAMAETKHGITVTSTSSNLQTNKQTTSWQRKPQLGDRAVRVKIKKPEGKVKENNR